MSAKGPELKVGDAIPGTKYRVVRSLGAGGMGVVYQVVKPPNIQGVLKLMSAELTQHEEHRVRFFDEVRILAQLDHPNIVRVFDYDALTDGTPFYVMELLSGRTVRDVIHTMGRVPPRVAYEITRQLLEALQAAHTHEVPVIHRDIKPENIFLHAPRHGEPVVKLIDFGVSAVADRKHDGAFVGTWSYAAPEQIRGQKPTPATDLYAAGLVLYEMLAGRGPFDHHDDWAKVSEAQLREIPAPVSRFAPWVPASIVTLIQSALAKDPRVRPRDAYAFAERLYELEWASDGKDPHDATAEGPALDVQPRPVGRDGAARGAAEGAAPAGRPAAVGASRPPLEIGGSGPLSRVLSTITSAPSHPPSNAMAAAADRLGDVPVLGVPQESVRSGQTWRGVGGRDHTAPDADALLAGLGVVGGKPPSRRERESNPDLEGPADVRVSPRPGRVVITPGALPRSREDGTPMTPPPGMLGPSTALTLDEVPANGSGSSDVNRGPPNRDTFSSQESDARRLPRSRTGLFVLAGALVLGGLVTAMIVVVRGAGRDDTSVPSATRNAAPPTTTAPIATADETATAPAASGASPTVEPTTTAAAASSPAAPAPPATVEPPPRKGGGAAAAAKPAPKPSSGKPAVVGTERTAPAAPATSPPLATPATPPAPKPPASGDFIRQL